MKYLDYPEEQKYGDLTYPYFYYYIDQTHPRYIMPFHWHPLFEIIHIIRGHFTLRLNEDTLYLGPGDSACISVGTTHSGVPDKNEECCYECLLFDMSAVFLASSSICTYEPRMTDIINQKLLVNPFIPARMNEINYYIRNLLDLFNPPYNIDILSLSANTFLMFSCILKNGLYSASDSEQSTKKYSILKKALSYIETHYQEDINLASLAAAVNLNPSYFCRYFKELTQKTPIDYLNIYRIETASEQMIFTDKSLTEIAYDCGFDDSSYFVKVFKHYKHMTPTQYLSRLKSS